MRDVELYKAILGLTPPWTVVDVTLDVRGQQVTVQVRAGDGPFPCPECATVVPGYGRKPRRWRHLDTCQFTTWIEADRKIVFDKFHIAKHLHDAVDQVRKAEHRTLQRAHDDRLTGTKYLWLMRAPMP